MIPALIARPLRARTVYNIEADEDAYFGSVASFTCDTWANLQGGLNLALNFSRTETYLECWLRRDDACGADGHWSALWRSMVVFLTSSLSTSFEASSPSQVRLHALIVPQTTIGSQNIVLVSAAPSSATTLASGDWANFGMTKWSNAVAVGDIANGSDTAFTLNAAGLSALNTQIAAGDPWSVGIVLESDADDTAPTVAATGNLNARQRFASTDHATAAYRPTLRLW